MEKWKFYLLVFILKSFFLEQRGQKLGCVLYTGSHYTRVNTVGFGLGWLKLIKHSSNRTSKIYHKRNFFFSFVHFRHPTDEQLQHVDIIFSNYYNLQSVHFVFVLSVPAHLDNWCFCYFAIKWRRLLHIP